MKNKVEDIIEVLILNHFLDTYRDFNIMSGGDIQKAEDNALATLKNIITLGSKAKSEVLKEEFRMYLDFHEQRDGLLDKDQEYQKEYLLERDEQVDEKVKEILKVAKNIIREQWTKEN